MNKNETETQQYVHVFCGIYFEALNRVDTQALKSFV